MRRKTNLPSSESPQPLDQMANIILPTIRFINNSQIVVINLLNRSIDQHW